MIKISKIQQVWFFQKLFS